MNYDASDDLIKVCYIFQGGLFHVLASVRDAQLEISGARIVQTTEGNKNEQTTELANEQTNEQTLCLVVSGFSATSKWAG